MSENRAQELTKKLDLALKERLWPITYIYTIDPMCLQKSHGAGSAKIFISLYHLWDEVDIFLPLWEKAVS